MGLEDVFTCDNFRSGTSTSLYFNRRAGPWIGTGILFRRAVSLSLYFRNIFIWFCTRLISSRGLVIDFYIVGYRLVVTQAIFCSRPGSFWRIRLHISQYSVLSYEFELCYQRYFNSGWVAIQRRWPYDLYLEDFLIFGIGRLEVFFFGLVCLGSFPVASFLLVFSASSPSSSLRTNFLLRESDWLVDFEVFGWVSDRIFGPPLAWPACRRGDRR